MKVVDKRTKDYRCKLNELSVGATFMYKDELFMVLSLNFTSNYVYIVSLVNGLNLNFSGDYLVTPVIVECNIVENVEVQCNN